MRAGSIVRFPPWFLLVEIESVAPIKCGLMKVP
jgi:hypothetical protein